MPLKIFFFEDWNQVLRNQHNITLKRTQMDPKGQNTVTIYIPIRQSQDQVVCKPELSELVIRIVLQMLSP